MRNNSENSEDAVADLALEESLQFNNARINIINADPTSSTFVSWFIISCYFPVITACLGPVANTISIACVVEKWRTIRESTGEAVTDASIVQDPTGIFVVNVISLVLGFISNIVLMLHFANKISYQKSQLINISGWTVAGGMLLIDVIVCGTRDFPPTYSRSIGFWYAAITSGLYFGCTFTLSIHYIGFIRGRYPPKFNLIKNERSLMLFTVFLSILLIWGGGMFSRLLHISYGNALYFSIVSILTIGLGDILPRSVAAKIMVLIFSILGVITMALILVMTRGIIQESSGPIIFFHRVEVQRAIEMQKILDGKVSFTKEEAFDKMVHIRHVARRKQELFSTFMTLGIFVVFWNLGGLVFMFAEDWSYFNSIYFAFLCLITIGYGDFAPKTGAGRAFFVVWALAAVPLMSAILSTLGDVLFSLAESLDLSVAKRFKLGLRAIVLKGGSSLNALILNSDEILPEEEGEEDEETEDADDDTDKTNTNVQVQEPPRSDYLTDERAALKRKPFDDDVCEDLGMTPIRLARGSSHQTTIATRQEIIYSKLEKLQGLLVAMKKFRKIARKTKNYSLTFQQWDDICRLYAVSDDSKMLADPNFWLSENNPLRFPLDQPHFALMKMFNKIEEMINELIEDEEVNSILSRRPGLLGSSWASSLSDPRSSSERTTLPHQPNRTRATSI